MTRSTAAGALRASIVTSLALLAALAVTATARAASFSACPKVRTGATCARVAVPLDHDATVAGSLKLFVTRLKARHASRKAMIYLSGGPGGAGISEFGYALLDKPIRQLQSTYDLVGFDQRGTGRSGLLRCPSIEHDPRLRSTRASELCAARLGTRRAFFTTRQTVEDLEAVRVAVGADKLFLYGVSYGTEVALAYARAHPDHVEKLLIDSVVDPDESDPWGLESFRAIGPTLRALCPGACKGVSTDPEADLAALVAKLGPGGSLSGLHAIDIADLLFDADYVPELRAGIPAGIVSALRFANAAPLKRIIRAAKPLSEPSRPSDFSAARYNAVCEETPLPWERTTPFDERLAEATRRAGELPADAFRPFDFQVIRGDEIDLCLRWPNAAAAPVLPNAGGAYPDVPVLLLQGGEDLRTPPAVSARIAQRFPHAQRVVVPGVGHAVLGSDPSRCAARRLGKWLTRPAATVAGTCARVKTGVDPVPVVPRRFSELETARGFSSRLGRTITGISLTLRDLNFELGPAFGLKPVYTGLAGGRFSLPGRGLKLRRYSTVRGLWLTGRDTRSGDLVVEVGGSAAAAGGVRLHRGRLTGTLGGRRVRARLG